MKLSRRIDGESVKNLSEEYGADTSCIYRWICRYRKGGVEALNTRPIGHFKHAKLTPEQQKTLVNIILTKDPTHNGFYKTLWSRDIVTAVNQDQFDITVHPAAVGKMLKRIGLTPQRPVRKGWQQGEKVREYLDIRCPALC